jgi:hypothetical protein
LTDTAWTDRIVHVTTPVSTEAEMIPYEELCQALDRFNARRRNAAELAELEQESPAAEQAVGLMDTQREGGELFDRGSFDQAVAELTEQEGGEDDSFAKQPAENTHEIDVDDMVVDDRLSDDKLPET